MIITKKCIILQSSKNDTQEIICYKSFWERARERAFCKKSSLVK